MTCIVGLIRNGKVFMGGDACVAQNYLTRTIIAHKVFFVGGLLVGHTSTVRLGQILQYCMRPLPVGAPAVSTEDWVINNFIPRVREAFYGQGFTQHFEQEGGQFMVGFQGTLWEVGSDFGVAQFSDGYSVIGTGRDFALGSLYTQLTEDPNPNRPGREIVQTALETAAKFCGTVEPPFTILEEAA